jgi:hypothetical protein
MKGNATWLANVLAAAGLTVIEHDGWQTRGRGEMGELHGVICHHTAGAKTGNAPSLSLVLYGRTDLAGPLSQLFLARNGEFHVLAAGRCNHAGSGSWQGISAGNTGFIGIEAENAGDGKDPWPAEQMDAYARGVAAILKHIGADAVMACGHKEFALPRGRKIDPSFDMIEFRGRVEAKMANGFGAMTAAVPPEAPARAMLRKGNTGDSVKFLQRKLGISIDGHFGPKTEAAVRALQGKHGLLVDGLVGPRTWKALGV